MKKDRETGKPVLIDSEKITAEATSCNVEEVFTFDSTTLKNKKYLTTEYTLRPFIIVSL
jgi:hypothetical protein